MSNISTIQIMNFRSIQNIEIEGFKQFNLIVGKNNCGKSTILEAIHFGLSMPKFIYVTQLNSLRSLATTSNGDISSAFHNLDFSKPITFEIKTTASKRKISILKTQSIEHYANQESTSTEKEIAYKIDVTRFDKKNYSTIYRPGQLSANQFAPPLTDSPELLQTDTSINTFFWTPNWANFNYSNALGQMIINKKKEYLINALQTIDENVKDIQLGANGTVFVDIGVSTLLPISLLGQGIEKILAIITTISSLQNGVILIDEFENGLHYTSMGHLWRILFEICKEQHIQLFVTTHSYECIESFISNSNDADVSIIRIEQDIENKRIPVSISKDAAKEAVAQQWELR